MKQNKIVLALLFGHINVNQALKLEGVPAGLPWKDDGFTDENLATIDSYTHEYVKLENQNLVQTSQPTGVFEAARDEEAGYPSTIPNELWPTHDQKDITKFVQARIDPASGRYKTEWEVEQEEAAVAESKLQKMRDAPYFTLNMDQIVPDWTGNKYVTTHRCFGGPCKSDLELLQVSESGAQPTGAFEAERDAEAGYPAVHDVDKETHEFIKSHIDTNSGRYKTTWEVQQDLDAEQEKKLQETYEKKRFEVPDYLVNDWTGHKYVTTHRCFGRPCEQDQLQLEDDKNPPKEWKEGTYKIGDLQEHKYRTQRAWAEGEMPHEEHQDKENVHKLIYERFDPEHGRFKNEWEIKAENQKKLEEAIRDQANQPAFQVKDSHIDDWTGDKYARNVYCYGAEPCDPEHYKVSVAQRPAHKSFIQTNTEVNVNGKAEVDADLQAEASLETEAEASTEVEITTEADQEQTYEPMDPTLADVDGIIKRYENEDAAKELKMSQFKIGNDKSGGINAIYAQSMAHNKDEDNRDLKRIFENYSSAAKGYDGLPKQDERVIDKWNAQLASDEIIRNWNTISDAAMEKFMRDYFDKVWKKYDMYDRGNIPEIEGVPFIRDLMAVLAPPELPEVNPYEVKEEKPVVVDPIVEPDIEVKSTENTSEKDKTGGKQATPKKTTTTKEGSEAAGKDTKPTSSEEKPTEPIATKE